MPENLWYELYSPQQAPVVDSRKKLAITAYEQLLYMFISLEILPGAQMQERDLAERLNMSRTPVREALMRLSNEKWVQINPRQNIIVRPVDLTTVREVFEVREMLELRGVDRIVSDEATYTEFVNMAIVHEIMTNNQVNNFDYILTNQKFHAYLSTIDHNSLIYDLWKRIHLENRRLALLTLKAAPTHKQVVQDEHCEIIDALLRRDSSLARERLLSHLRNMRSSLERSLIPTS